MEGMLDQKDIGGIMEVKRYTILRKIEKDDSFEKYLEYQKEVKRIDERAQQKRKRREAAKELTRRKSGAQGLSGLYDRTKSQLESGLIVSKGHRINYKVI